MLKIENLSYAYSDTMVLNNVSFEIKKNEIVGLLGLSGSGKTTLLKILSGLLKPNQGTYTIESLNAFERGKRNPVLVNELGVVFQDYNLFMHLTVLDNLVLPYRLRYKKSKVDSKRVAIDLLSQFGLEEHLYKYPNECSGGQQQRIAIARALILNPKVLLIDEPTAALDQENTRLVLQLIKDLNKKGLTVVVITHDLPFAQSICQRVIELKSGQIVVDIAAKDYFNALY